MEMVIGIERIIIVIIGGLCIYLGYQLFLNLPVQQEGEGRIKLPGDISIYVSRVGPGVFFALFGSIILCSSLYFAIIIFDPETGNPVVRGVGDISGQQMDFDADFAGRFEINRSNLQGDLVILNSASQNFKSDTPEKFRKDWERAIERTKLTLLAHHWEAAWGDFNTFKNRVELNEQDQLPPSYELPVKMFFVMQGGK